MKTPAITATLKGAISREGISGTRLSKLTGIPYQTLIYRYKNPSTWRFCEWAAVTRHIKFNESELEAIRKEVEKL